MVRVQELAARFAPQMKITVQPPYYDQPDYIAALVASAADYLKQDYDHLLFSYHGIPERHLRKSDPTGCHCLQSEECCTTESPARATCYRAQCFATTAAFVKLAGVPKEKYSVSFQSRLGRTPWITPHTDVLLDELPKQGTKRLAVMCPAFVADCLETLEEIGLRAREQFRAAGGEELVLVPSLNATPRWVEAVAQIAERHAARKLLPVAVTPGARLI